CSTGSARRAWGSADGREPASGQQPGRGATPARQRRGGAVMAASLTEDARLRVGSTRRLLASGALRRLVALAIPFAAWEVAARLADNRLLPGPVTVVRALLEDLTSGGIWFRAQLTFQRGALGVAIARVVGLGFGVLLARVRWAGAMFEPLLGASYPVPKLALYPLVILLLGFGGASKVAMV